MNTQFRVINSQNSLDEACKELSNIWELRKWLMMQVTTEKQRSRLQNNSLHLWCDWVAQELNSRGLDVRQVLAVSKRPEIPWTMPAVKEHLWRPVQIAYSGKPSTTEPSTGEFSAVFEVLSKALGEQFGFHVPWPNKNEMGLRNGYK